MSVTHSASPLDEIGHDIHQTKEWLKRHGGRGHNGQFGEIDDKSVAGGDVLTPDKVEGYTIEVQEECRACGVERFTQFTLEVSGVTLRDRFESIREYAGTANGGGP